MRHVAVPHVSVQVFGEKRTGKQAIIGQFGGDRSPASIITHKFYQYGRTHETQSGTDGLVDLLNKDLADMFLR